MSTVGLVRLVAFLLVCASLACPALEEPFRWSASVSDAILTVETTVPTGCYLYAESTSVDATTADSKQPVPTLSSPDFKSHADTFGELSKVYGTGLHQWHFAVQGAGPWKLSAKYQGCSEKPAVCFPPGEWQATIGVGKTIVESKATPRQSIEASAEVKVNGTGIAFFDRMIAKGGVWLFGSVFVLGLLSVLTPCVLPMLPITLAVLGAGKEAGRGRGLRRSLLYAFGICLTFTALAVAAAMAGGALGGDFMANPYVLGAFGLFFVAMSLSMLGLFELPLPGAIQDRVGQIGGGGETGALLMGLAAGFVAVPCTGPVLAALLGIAAASGNILFSAALFSCYSAGFGLPFVIVGAGAASMPKAGPFMDVVKSFVGVAILCLGVYVLSVAVKPLGEILSEASETAKFLVIALLCVGPLLGALHGDGHSPKRLTRIAKLLGAAAMAVGVVWLARLPVAQHTGTADGLRWGSDLPTALAEAASTGRGVLLDFKKELCPACKEMEMVTFAAPAVVEALRSRWILVSVNETYASSADKELLRRFDVRGFPLVVLLTPNGAEAARQYGFIPPNEFLAFLSGATL